MKIMSCPKLEQEYRSTKNILETASNLISNNSNGVGKKLWSSASQESCKTKLL